MKFYKCDTCGKIIVMINEKQVPTTCCGQKMHIIEPQEAEMATEKHVPVIEKNGNQVKVYVGSTEHPMTEKHYIQWIIIETNQGFYKKDLAIDSKPEAYFGIVEDEEITAAYEYCNIHGLWMNKIK